MPELDRQTRSLFAVEKLNHVLEEAQLMEMSAHGQRPCNAKQQLSHGPARLLTSSSLLCCSCLRCSALSVAVPRWSESGVALVGEWRLRQLRQCLRCLEDLHADALPGCLADEPSLRPVGGWTLDESAFLQLYGCLLLTRALLIAHWSQRSQRPEQQLPEDEQAARQRRRQRRRTQTACASTCCLLSCSRPPCCASPCSVLLQLQRSVAEEGRDDGAAAAGRHIQAELQRLMRLTMRALSSAASTQPFAIVSGLLLNAEPE